MGLWDDLPAGTPDLLVARNPRVLLGDVSRDPSGRAVFAGTLKTERPFKPYKATKKLKSPKKLSEAVVIHVYDEAKHRRGRGGRWVDMPDRVARPMKHQFEKLDDDRATGLTKVAALKDEW